MNCLEATEQGAAVMIFDEKYAAKVETLPGDARLVSISLPTKGAAWGVTISRSFDEIKDMLKKNLGSQSDQSERGRQHAEKSP